ncbi:MAG: hypothetical protein JWR80_9523 [Bradyrhizobium sp.]|nr:hypothetical protein [Bradyrhizobium sp.]
MVFRMNMASKAQDKPLKVVANAEPDTLRIWNAVCRTDPRHTKKVNQRGGFTAIDAQYQIMEATRLFGPLGEGWGYNVGEYQIVGTLIVVPVTLWHSGDRSKIFGPVLGCAEMLGQRPDRDAPKKAVTDAITKGLSQLGFNADVFLGLFDDNKYIAEVTKEFAGGNPKTDEEPPVKRAALEGPYTSKTALWTAFKQFDRTLRGIGDLAEFEAFIQTDDAVELLDQCKRDAPALYDSGEGLPVEFEPALTLIKRLRDELANADESWRTNPVLAG